MIWYHIPNRTAVDPLWSIRSLSDYSGSYSVLLKYSGADQPTITIDGIDQIVGSFDGSGWPVTMEFIGSSEKEILIFSEEDDQFEFVNSSAYFSGIDLGITLIDLSQLTGIDSDNLYLKRNIYTTVILPPVDINEISILGTDNANDYSDSEIVTITGGGTYSDLYVQDFNKCSIKIDDLSLRTKLQIGGRGNTTSTANTCWYLTLPTSNSEDFSFFEIGGVYQSQDIDLSLWSGAFSGKFSISNQGVGPKLLTLPNNMDGVDDLYIGNHRTMGTANNIVLDNGSDTCPKTEIYRNGIWNLSIYNPTFDLSDWGMSDSLELHGFGNDFAGIIILAALNTNDFSMFRYESIMESPLVVDFTGWTGNFTNTVAIGNCGQTEEFRLMPNIAGVTNFKFSQNYGLLDFPLNLSGITLLTSCVIYRHDNNGTSSNRILTLPQCKDDLRVYSFSDSRPVNWIQVNFPSTNTNDFWRISMSNVGNSTINFSNWTGDIIRQGDHDFTIQGNPNLTSLSLGFGVIQMRHIIIRRCEQLDFYFEIGAQILPDLADSYVDFSMNDLSQSNIDDMIDDINTNNAALQSGQRFNFSRSNTNSNNSTNIGTNEVPSSSKITLISTLNSTYGFVFNYWNGSSNVKVG